MALYKMSYYPEPNYHSRNKIKVELDFGNYAAKSDGKMQQQSLLKRMIWVI